MSGRPRASRGAHYTPVTLARYLAALALQPWLETHTHAATTIRVLDPACGDGVLLEAVRTSYDTERHRHGGHWPALQLVGIDIAPDAIESARHRLTRPTDGNASCQLVVGDTLAELPVLDGGFDLVVGNPPYVFGEHLAPLGRRALAERYELGRRGQPDLFKLFYERTLALLRTGGRHVFLVPDALLARDEHADLRHLLATRLRIDRICQVGRVFATASGVASVVVAGDSVSGGPTVDRPEVAVDRWSDAGPRPSHTAPRAALIGGDGSPWSIDAPASWFGPEGLRARLERPGVCLAQLLAPGRLGLTRGEELGKRSLDRLDDSTRATWQGRPHGGRTPIYAGESVHRHWLAPATRQAPLSVIAKNTAYYAAPKILFVKTGAGPVATTCDDDLPTLQSVYTLHLNRDVAADIDEDAVVAVLCSALLATYCWHRWTFGKRLQPQLTLANLRQLPFPPLPRLVAASVTLSRKVSRLRAGLLRQENVAPVERELDEQIAQLYGLALDEWESLVVSSLRRLPRSQRSRWVAD